MAEIEFRRSQPTFGFELGPNPGGISSTSSGNHSITGSGSSSTSSVNTSGGHRHFHGIE